MTKLSFKSSYIHTALSFEFVCNEWSEFSSFLSQFYSILNSKKKKITARQEHKIKSRKSSFQIKKNLETMFFSNFSLKAYRSCFWGVDRDFKVNFYCDESMRRSSRASNFAMLMKNSHDFDYLLSFNGIWFLTPEWQSWESSQVLPLST